MKQLLRASNLSKLFCCLQCTDAGGGHEAAPVLTLLLVLSIKVAALCMQCPGILPGNEGNLVMTRKGRCVFVPLKLFFCACAVRWRR